MEKQVVLIHGGDPFGTYEEYLEYLKNFQVDFSRHALRVDDWQVNLAKRLGSDYQVIRPDMPSKRNAKYLEWKIWFEKFIPFLESEIIIVGSSLGGTFVAKYLAENNFPKKIKAALLIAGAFKDLDEEKLGDFLLPLSLDKFALQAEKIFLYHSKDDDTVPFEHVNDFKKALPKAVVRIFEDRRHFNQPELPELTEDIKRVQ